MASDLKLAVSVPELMGSRRDFLDAAKRQNSKPRRVEPSSCPRTYGKRRYSCSTGGSGPNESKGVPIPFKRRHKGASVSIPPTKFLLGGNINDPLNLGSLADDEINRSLNEVTPYSSPVPTPMSRNQVEVLIPPNINDPLNLNANDDQEIEMNLISPKTRRRKQRKRKKHASGDTTAEDRAEEDEEDGHIEKIVEASMKHVEEGRRPSGSKSKKVDDKIVSPVIPQQVSRKRPSAHGKADSDKDQCARGDGLVVKRKHGKRGGKEGSKEGKARFRPKDTQFQYGNYNRYYGYRNAHAEEDPRLCCMRREWFQGKDTLDLGCNVGFFTFSIARDFDPRRTVGLDIDPKLISVARKNVRHYLSAESGSSFPISLPLTYGPIAATNIKNRETQAQFPNNIMFVQGNYILERDELLEMQQCEFDTVLCLSLTKWVHLNWGDDGLKRMFKRIYAQLRPGGRLILEAQAWQSYARKKKLTRAIFENYQRIQLRPEQFTEYLLSREVGFSTCEVIDTPFNVSKGFRRPIQLFTKGEGLSPKAEVQTCQSPKKEI